MPKSTQSISKGLNCIGGLGKAKHSMAAFKFDNKENMIEKTRLKTDRSSKKSKGDRIVGS